MDTFLKSFLETALWASTNSRGTPLDKRYKVKHFSKEALDRFEKECQSFQKQAGDVISGREDRAGYHFWLTRNGHGAGFWDGDWAEHGEELTKLAKSFGEVWLLASNGKIYCM